MVANNDPEYISMYDGPSLTAANRGVAAFLDDIADIVRDRDEQAWRQQAACRGMDQSLFFPGKGDNKIVDAAKQICMRCPVQEECRSYALSFSHTSLDGVWGALSGRQRLVARQKRVFA